MRVCKYCGSPLYGFDQEVCQNCHKTQGHPYIFMMIVVIITFSVAGMVKTVKKKQATNDQAQTQQTKSSSIEQALPEATLGQ